MNEQTAATVTFKELPDDIIIDILRQLSSVREVANVICINRRIYEVALRYSNQILRNKTCSFNLLECDDKTMIAVNYELECEVHYKLNRRQRVKLIETEVNRLARLKKHLIFLLKNNGVEIYGNSSDASLSESNNSETITTEDFEKLKQEVQTLKQENFKLKRYIARLESELDKVEPLIALINEAREHKSDNIINRRFQQGSSSSDFRFDSLRAHTHRKEALFG
jgi:cell division protein FtsB